MILRLYGVNVSPPHVCSYFRPFEGQLRNNVFYIFILPVQKNSHHQKKGYTL